MKRKEKIATIERHYRELEAAKKAVAKEVVFTLDLFDGKLSLADVMNTEIPFLDKLKECKMEALELNKNAAAKAI